MTKGLASPMRTGKTQYFNVSQLEIQVDFAIRDPEGFNRFLVTNSISD